MTNSKLDLANKLEKFLLTLLKTDNIGSFLQSVFLLREKYKNNNVCFNFIDDISTKTQNAIKTPVNNRKQYISQLIQNTNFFILHVLQDENFIKDFSMSL